MLRTYVSVDADWEPYLNLILFAYRTAIHSSTGVSSFELMFGQPPGIFNLPSQDAFNTGTYPYVLRSKLAQLQDIVETNVPRQATGSSRTTVLAKENSTFSADYRADFPRISVRCSAVVHVDNWRISCR